jgi:hypothetical protein
MASYSFVFITVLNVQGIYNNMDKCVLDLSLVMDGWFVCMEITPAPLRMPRV